MDDNTLKSQVKKYFQEKKHLLLDTSVNKESTLTFSDGELKWAIVLCADQAEELDYLKTFETAMQTLIHYGRAQSETTKFRLSLALAFSSSLRGNKNSYRRALKKYSNSIVFDDLDIHLILVEDDAQINHLSPKEVNAFLRVLDTYIIERKANH